MGYGIFIGVNPIPKLETGQVDLPMDKRENRKPVVLTAS